MDFFAFDIQYVDRLRKGDPATEHHFFVYFELLNIKLRSRMISANRIEDLKQETFARAIAAVRKEGVAQPERFGAFVNSICNNVALEHYGVTMPGNSHEQPQTTTSATYEAPATVPSNPPIRLPGSALCAIARHSCGCGLSEQ